MAEKIKRPTFGRIARPGIGYNQGSRQMVSTVLSPVQFVNAIGEREEWDPLSGTGTNRREDRQHRRGIAEYLSTNADYVLNSILVYLSPDEAEFVGDDPGAPVSLGTLYIDADAKMVVGDGGHRSSAYGDVIDAHRPLADDVFARMTENGQPVVVVLDDNQVRRVQDFTDLQNNAKPLNQSVAQSMDRRELVNRMLLEAVIKAGDVPVFDNGKRVEFLTDSPGKLSAKIASYKTLRYASGTLLVGTGYRSTKAWAEAVDLLVLRDADGAAERVIAFWQGYSDLPPVAQALSVDRGVAILREDTWLTSANVMYALAAAVHNVTTGEDAMTTAEAFTALGSFDFTRAATGLHGTLVDPPLTAGGNPKARTGRDAWESAAAVFTDVILQSTTAT